MHILNSHRAQTSAEFTFALVIFLIIMLAAFAIYLDISNGTLNRIKYLKAKNTADMLASRINGIDMGGDNEAETFAVLDRPDYNITLEGSSIKVEFNDIAAYSHLKTNNVILDFNSTSLKIKKSNEVVYIENK